MNSCHLLLTVTMISEYLEANMEDTDIEPLIDTAQKIMKKLHKSKYKAGMGKTEIIERKKKRRQEIKDLEVPTVTGTINYKRWFKAVQTKNKNLRTAI